MLDLNKIAILNGKMNRQEIEYIWLSKCHRLPIDSEVKDKFNLTPFESVPIELEERIIRYIQRRNIIKDVPLGHRNREEFKELVREHETFWQTLPENQ